MGNPSREALRKLQSKMLMDQQHRSSSSSSSTRTRSLRRSSHGCANTGCTLLSQSYTCSCLRFHKKKVQKQAKAVDAQQQQQQPRVARSRVESTRCQSSSIMLLDSQRCSLNGSIRCKSMTDSRVLKCVLLSLK